MEPPPQDRPPQRSRTRDAEVRRVSRITRSVAALAVAGVAVGAGFAATSHQAAASWDPSAGVAASPADTGRQFPGIPASAPAASSATPVASSGAS